MCRQKEFLKSISRLEKNKYRKYLFTYLASPVLLGVKPSVTINFKECEENLFSNIILDEIKDNNIKWTYLKKSNGTKIIFLYNIKLLSNKLKENSNILKKAGYDEKISLAEKIEILKKRYFGNIFPHEIGIFLGIPSEDVEGFMANRECLYIGYWKVYSNIGEAKNTFALYDRAKEIMIDSLENGDSLGKTLEDIRFKNENRVRVS